MDILRKRALDIALEGRSEAEAKAQLIRDFHGDDVTGEQINNAVYYAYRGGDSGLVDVKNPPDEAAPNKRSVRKAMIMLKVNYKNADAGAVTDCLVDLQHYCHAKAIDYLTCEAQAQGHFIDQAIGGEND